MSVEDYLQKQNSLQLQAEEILSDLNLINFLSKFGKPTIVGSYALSLMSRPDIDIVVVSQMKIQDYLETVTYLFPKQNIYSLSLQDFRKSIYPDRPQGLYCGISFLVKPKTFWKIDIWFLPVAKALDLVNSVKSRLTDENRLTILKIKNEMREKTKHGKEVSGMDVYKAVLDNGVRDLEEFRRYLKEQGRVL